MGFYHLDLDRLAEFSGRTVDDLKTESYASLEAMSNSMEHEKFVNQNKKNAEDAEYERLVLKFFEPLDLLRHWFDDREIVLSCARTGVRDSQICQEVNVEPGGRCWYSNAEYVRTSVESVRQFDKKGRELMESARMKRDVYHVAGQYQGLCHGQVILDLLYGRYPELARFGFQAYGMGGDLDYEIYPKNNIYTSLAALMSGDVDWILHRNREYCKWYNNGRYSEAECEKAFHTEEAKAMFDMIRDIGEKERALGHSPVRILESGAMITAQHLITTKVSESGNITLLMRRDAGQGRKDKEPFKLAAAAPYALDRLVAEFLDMVPKDAGVNIHIGHKADHLMEHAVECGFTAGRRNAVFDGTGKFTVLDAFGWQKGNLYDLTLRINCPELMEN